MGGGRGALFRNFALCVKRVRQVYRKSYIYGWKSFFFLGPLYKSCT